MTVGAMLLTAKLAVMCDSYEQAQSRLLQRDIDVNDDAVRAITNNIGRLVFDNEKKYAQDAYLAYKNGKLRFDDEKLSHVLYLEVDGAMVPTRKEKEIEKNARTVGSGKVNDRQISTKSQSENSVQKSFRQKSFWLEHKIGGAFSTDDVIWFRDIDGEMRHRILKKDFTSYIGEASEFNKMMLALAIRNGYGSCKETVIISDGAVWTHEMKNEFFPDAQLILNFRRLCENASNFAESVFDSDEKKYIPWFNEMKELFRSSKANEALIKIKSLSKRQLSKTSLDLAQYIENNLENIDYKSYLDKGYFIGGDFMESSNRSVLQERAMLPGMRWNVDCVQNVVALLGKIKSDRWEEDVVRAVYKKYNVAPGQDFSLSPRKEEF
jgi:hypothetical protein